MRSSPQRNLFFDVQGSVGTPIPPTTGGGAPATGAGAVIRHSTAPNTSALAEPTAAVKTRQRAQIRAWLKVHGEGFCEQIAIATGIPYTACSARLSDMRADGEIYRNGELGTTSHGKAAKIVRLTKEGMML